ncbi:MAG: hypothetical protein M3O70_11005 [Actinomycetota bacterium]|nr:hypothetical protein [Actinomycetota bacterium]
MYPDGGDYAAAMRIERGDDERGRVDASEGARERCDERRLCVIQASERTVDPDDEDPWALLFGETYGDAVHHGHHLRLRLPHRGTATLDLAVQGAEHLSTDRRRQPPEPDGEGVVRAASE